MLPSFLQNMVNRKLPNGGGSYSVANPFGSTVDSSRLGLRSGSNQNVLAPTPLQIGGQPTSTLQTGIQTGGNNMTTQEMDKLRAMAGQPQGNPNLGYGSVLGDASSLGLVNGNTTGGSSNPQSGLGGGGDNNEDTQTKLERIMNKYSTPEASNSTDISSSNNLYNQWNQERNTNTGLYALPQDVVLTPDQQNSLRVSADKYYSGLVESVGEHEKNQVALAKAKTDEMEVDGDFQATINEAARAETGFGANQRVTKQLMQLAATKDYKSLLVGLKNQGAKRISAAEVSEINKADKQIKSMTRMSEALTAYMQIPGADMNFLKGKQDDILSYFGKLGAEPQYKSLATQLTAAFQQYRQDMTGAAFGADENRDYASVLPGKGNNLDLNLAIIEGLKTYMTGKVDDSYVLALGEGYTYVKELAEGKGQTTRSTNQNTVQKSQVSEALQKINPDTGKNYTQEEIDDYLKSKGVSFNSVGNTQDSVEIPKSSRLSFVNNNPGNLRFAGQQGASQGEGGFARFESPQAGATALQRQIQLDASRGHTLASFINKFAPPSENNTSEYVSQAMKNLGVSSDTKISNIPLDKLTRFMALKESSTKIS